MRIETKKFISGDILRGRPLGRKHFARMCETLAKACHGDFVFVDFTGVKAVNGSWLNSAISELFRWAKQDHVNIYPVLFGFPERDIDELELVAAINKACYPCTNSLKLPLNTVNLVGALDENLSHTLELVGKSDGITGAELGKNEGIGATAWNNRLKDLHDLRLVTRKTVGRRQVYGPLAKEMFQHGRQYS